MADDVHHTCRSLRPFEWEEEHPFGEFAGYWDEAVRAGYLSVGAPETPHEFAARKVVERSLTGEAE